MTQKKKVSFCLDSSEREVISFFLHSYKGDSGGPFVCNEGGRWVLRGAVSWGHGKCRTDHYTVFARVSNFVDWIKQKQSSKFLILLRKRNF